jgi:hypothetical protein
MRKTLADQLKEAYALARREISTQPQPSKPLVAEPVDKSHPQEKQNPKAHPQKTHVTPRAAKPAKAWPLEHPPRQEPPPLDLSVYRNGVHGKPVSPTKPNPVDGHYDLIFPSQAQPSWRLQSDDEAPPLLVFDLTGQQVQATADQPAYSKIDRELVLGLDFGTSSVKVVFGDPAIGRSGKAFAVPFRSAEGLSGFLLPCRLYRSADTFSLTPEGLVFADLKLALLAHPEADDNRLHVVAFLALAIRRARAWLFTQHEAVYRSNNIIWRMAIGLPTANHLEPEQADLFEQLGWAAWILAGNDAEVITQQLATTALSRASHLRHGEAPTEQEDVEISVIPEIAAQIYGYVASEQFDPKAANNFMMVDVGAGTVDTSLFQVKRGSGGKWDFIFFTATVEPLGVVNLHRHRLNWWSTVIQDRCPDRVELLEAISEARLVSDTQTGLPEKLEDYFSAVSLVFTTPAQHADRLFYKKVFKQVAHETYWETSQGRLSRIDLTDLPVYLCGGGSRLPFYEQLRYSLNNHPSMYEWMRVKIRQLTKPNDLMAPGLPIADFDRLSVAYGLSFLDLGKVLKAVPKPEIPVTSSDAWRDNYIEK